MSRSFLIVAIIVAVVIIGVVLYGTQVSSPLNSEPQRFNLNEFGIAILVPGSVDDLAYEPRTQNGVGTVLHMKVENECEIGVFYKIEKNRIAQSRTSWTRETLQAAMVATDDKPAQVKEFTDFYLVFEPSQAACSSDADTIAREQKKRTDVWSAVTTAQFMQ
jgi:hypothetical protein